MVYIDPVESSPNNYKLLFENDEVRVLEMSLRSGETDEEHSHPSETPSTSSTAVVCACTSLKGSPSRWSFPTVA